MEEIKYYELTTHEVEMVSEFVSTIVHLGDESWVKELMGHCLKVGKVWGAFRKSGDLLSYVFFIGKTSCAEVE